MDASWGQDSNLLAGPRYVRAFVVQGGGSIVLKPVVFLRCTTPLPVEDTGTARQGWCGIRAPACHDTVLLFAVFVGKCPGC